MRLIASALALALGCFTPGVAAKSGGHTCRANALFAFHDGFSGANEP
jgi:hypothetical protein